MRICDLERARAAARTCLRGVEQLRVDAPNEAEQAEAKKSREALRLAVKQLLGMGSLALANKWGPHWVIEEKEAESIADPALEVIENELGAMPEDPWARLLLAVGMVAIPRVLLSFAPPPPPSSPSSSSKQPTVDVEAKVTKETNKA